MRILQISHRHHIAGGSDAVFFETSALLRRAGHEVIPFCMDAPENTPSRWSDFFPAGADTRGAPLRHALRYFYNAEARQKLDLLLDEAGPIDVAHLHIYHGKQTPAILPVLRARGIPVIQTLHEYKLACPVYTLQRGDAPCELCVRGSDLNALRHRCKDGSLLRSLVMVAEKASARLLGDLRLVDRFICVSDFQRQIMKRAGIPSTKLTTLHNFVDTDLTEPARGHKGYLLFAGRIETLKGIETLLDAVQITGQRLVVAGNGTWRPALERRIRALPQVTYAGFRSGRALRELIAGARAVVVPSQWYENCPMSVLEAKAAARPVIGARIGGIPELVRDGCDGFLFEPGSVPDLVRALSALDRANHHHLSVNARQDAVARFSGPVHLDRLLRHYREVADIPAPAGLQLARA